MQVKSFRFLQTAWRKNLHRSLQSSKQNTDRGKWGRLGFVPVQRSRWNTSEVKTSQSSLVPLQPKEGWLWLCSGRFEPLGKKGKNSQYFRTEAPLPNHRVPETKWRKTLHPKHQILKLQNSHILAELNGSGKGVRLSSPERSRRQLRFQSGWRLAETPRSTDPGWVPAADTESSGTAAAGTTRWDERRQLKPAAYNQ